MTAQTLHLLVTAGPTYSPSSHHLLPINTSTPLQIHSPHITAGITIRIQNYRGLPSSSPSTSSYFTSAQHKADLYSIAFSFTLNEDIPGTDLLFGNDFEKPIRDRLPTGFGTAYRLLRWAIDPGLDGDVYAEHPYLYGPLLSSINVLRVGGKEKASGSEHKSVREHKSVKEHTGNTKHDDQEQKEVGDDIITEGADGEEAESIRLDLKIPDDGAKRMKHFLNKAHKEAFVFEAGRKYSCDFFNGYLDFNDLALKLPGVTMKLVDFWDGQPLRYVLKHRNVAKGIDQELFVITFTLIPEEELEAQREKWEGSGAGGKGDAKEKEKSQKESKGQDEHKKQEGFQDDDVD